jgi:predicted lipoprotein with Yx(FWY)xxD motif
MFVTAAATALVLAACGSSSSSTRAATSAPTKTSASASTTTAAAAAATVGASAQPSLGTILVDAHGMTLYHNVKEAGTTIVCTGGCASAWPPLLATPGAAPTGGTGITGTLATLTRPDGGSQVTYNGMALYHFSADQKPGDTKGQEVGKVWFVVPVNAAAAAVTPLTPAPSTPGPSTVIPPTTAAPVTPATAAPRATTPPPTTTHVTAAPTTSPPTTASKPPPPPPTTRPPVTTCAYPPCY